jgi:hypothetical protein
MPRHQAPQPSTDSGVRLTGLERRGRLGLIVLVAVMMIILGFFHAFQGVVALFNEGYYLVRRTVSPSMSTTPPGPDRADLCHTRLRGRLLSPPWSGVGPRHQRDPAPRDLRYAHPLSLRRSAQLARQLW